MNDMRRTLLWVVFTMSLVLLWDGWNKYNGQPTLFGAPVAAPVAAGPAPGSSANAGLPAPAGAVGSVVAKKDAYENLRAFVGPIGAGRPSAGKDRNDADAFLTIDAPPLTHIDWVVGRDVKGSAVGYFDDALGAFLLKQTTPGGVVIPVHR